MKKGLVTGALGALGMYLFDPQQGRGRRAKLQDQISAWLRRSAREADQRIEYAKGRAEGLRHLGTSDQPPESDRVLTAKVESEVLSDYPKGQIAVNSVDGVVELRGVCETPDQIDELEQEVRKVTGVIDVHNYLHLPNTPAPNKQEARRAT